MWFYSLLKYKDIALQFVLFHIKALYSIVLWFTIKSLNSAYFLFYITYSSLLENTNVTSKIVKVYIRLFFNMFL